MVIIPQDGGAPGLADEADGDHGAVHTVGLGDVGGLGEGGRLGLAVLLHACLGAAQGEGDNGVALGDGDGLGGLGVSHVGPQGFHHGADGDHGRALEERGPGAIAKVQAGLIDQHVDLADGAALVQQLHGGPVIHVIVVLEGGGVAVAHAVDGAVGQAVLIGVAGFAVVVVGGVGDGAVGDVLLAEGFAFFIAELVAVVVALVIGGVGFVSGIGGVGAAAGVGGLLGGQGRDGDAAEHGHGEKGRQEFFHGKAPFDQGRGGPQGSAASAWGVYVFKKYRPGRGICSRFPRCVLFGPGRFHRGGGRRPAQWLPLRWA